jgi:hypothetical protein
MLNINGALTFAVVTVPVPKCPHHIIKHNTYIVPPFSNQAFLARYPIISCRPSMVPKFKNTQIHPNTSAIIPQNIHIPNQNSDAYVQTEYLSSCRKPNTTTIALRLSFLNLYIPLIQFQLI